MSKMALELRLEPPIQRKMVVEIKTKKEISQRHERWRVFHLKKRNYEKQVENLIQEDVEWGLCGNG